MPSPSERAEEMGRRLLRVPGGASAGAAQGLILWAAWQLESAAFGWRTYRWALPIGDANPIGARMATVEIAAQNLVYRCVVTAMDLCAAAAHHLATGGPPSPGKEADVGWWLSSSRIYRVPGLPPAISTWLSQLDSSADWNRLTESRNAITHRATPRGVDINIGAGRVEVLVKVGGKWMKVDELMPRFIRLGERRFGTFAAALRIAYPLR